MTDDRFPGSPGPHDDERVLRVLLERAVPRLPVPATRLDKVRERLARRRRRRAAGGAAVAVVSLVAAGALLPDALRTEPEKAPPAASPKAVTEPAGVRVSFPELGGLVLRLPASWAALRLPDGVAQKTKTLPSGYVAAQPLRPYDEACSELKKPDGSGVACEPVERLAPGGLLLSLWGLPGGRDGKEALPAGTPMERARDVPPGCRQLGATAYYTTTRATADSTTALYAALCVNGTGSDRRAAEVSALLDSATYDLAPPTESPAPKGRGR
ncbi:hypothetical protein [Streptomyces sp. BPTC-684]|uniref:hypothetical protein n=1 Tax=Streptomyces sp. BPTC-684 TaxID=3043734 RepID=UPI0024B11164|nr:hypothetical protein [Streptomyces sp. BPTC-684]WHM37827.1 hypothetical protein QIY60_13545 [Streptomyces sp. BPTC-684]